MDNTTLSDSVPGDNTIPLNVAIPYMAFAVCSIVVSFIPLRTSSKVLEKSLHNTLVLILFLGVGLNGVVFVWFAVSVSIPSIHSVNTCFFTLIIGSFTMLINPCTLFLISIERHLVVITSNFGIQEKLNKYKYCIVAGAILFPCVVSLTVLLIPHRTETQRCHAPTFFGEYYATYVYLYFGNLTALGLAIVVTTLTTSLQIWRMFFRPKSTLLITSRRIIDITFTMGTRIDVEKKLDSSHAETREATVDSVRSQMFMRDRKQLFYAVRSISVSSSCSIHMVDAESNYENGENKNATDTELLKVKNNSNTDTRDTESIKGNNDINGETVINRSVKVNDKNNTEPDDTKSVKGNEKRNAEPDDTKSVKGNKKGNAETNYTVPNQGNDQSNAETCAMKTVKGNVKGNPETSDLETVKLNHKMKAPTCDNESVKGNDNRNKETGIKETVTENKNAETSDMETVKGKQKIKARRDNELFKDSNKKNAETGNIETVTDSNKRNTETREIATVKDSNKRNAERGDIETVTDSNKRNVETGDIDTVKDSNKRNSETGDIETVKDNNKRNAETGDIETVKDSNKRNAGTVDNLSVKSSRENDRETADQTTLKNKCTNIAQKNSNQIRTKASDVKYVRHTSWEAKAFKTSIMIALLTIFLTGPFVAAFWVELYNIPVSQPLKFVLNILFIINYTVEPYLYIWGIPEIKERLIPCRHH